MPTLVCLSEKLVKRAMAQPLQDSSSVGLKWDLRICLFIFPCDSHADYLGATLKLLQKRENHPAAVGDAAMLNASSEASEW